MAVSRETPPRGAPAPWRRTRCARPRPEEQLGPIGCASCRSSESCGTSERDDRGARRPLPGAIVSVVVLARMSHSMASTSPSRRRDRDGGRPDRRRLAAEASGRPSRCSCMRTGQREVLVDGVAEQVVAKRQTRPDRAEDPGRAHLPRRSGSSSNVDRPSTAERSAARTSGRARRRRAATGASSRRQEREPSHDREAQLAGELAAAHLDRPTGSIEIALVDQRADELR